MRTRTSTRLWFATGMLLSFSQLALPFELPGTLIPRIPHGICQKDRDDIASVRCLGEVDCYWYPESQKTLLETLKTDPREPVRYASAQALFDQLQRGRKPLKPLNGRREFPDPLLLSQIACVARFQEPMSMAQLSELYANRKLEREREEYPERGDVQYGCSADDAIPVLLSIASSKQNCGCFNEPSDRVRKVVGETLALLKPELEQSLSKKPVPVEPVPNVPPIVQVPSTEELQQNLLSLDQPETRGSYLQTTNVILGRADTANRFNFFDNMSAVPRSRIFGAYQYAQSQNNAVFGSANLGELFQNLTTAGGQASFISFTGFGSGIAGQPLVTPDGSAASAQQLNDLFTSANSGTGRTTQYLLFPNANIYRIGFEYALTPDFSFTAQGQYVAPIGSFEQPADVSNPLFQLKHVIFRDDLTVISTVLGISPEIPHRSAAIQEKTSRLNKGILFLRQFAHDDRWFMQGGSGFSVPTRADQIMTWDYGLSVGRFIYRHESLLTGEPTDKFLLGIVPQFEVLGKEIVGSNQVKGAFGLNSTAPLTAPGTLSPVDGTRTIYFPQDPSRAFTQSTFVYREPRHVVDLTMGTSFIFSQKRTLSLGLSVPVTGGNARVLEFLTSFNMGF